MTDKDYQRFADSIHSLIPDFTLNAEEIKTMIATRGLEGFIQKHAAGLAEAAELLQRNEIRGMSDEAG